MDWAYLCVALIGLLVGSGELLDRYKDEPVKALSSFAAAFYVAVNIGAALLPLVFIDAFNWVANDDTTKAFLLRVTTAGVGAMTLFRSAVFNARVGQKDVGIGLSGLLQLFLDAADRAVDRWRATPVPLWSSTSWPILISRKPTPHFRRSAWLSCKTYRLPNRKSLPSTFRNYARQRRLAK